MAGNEFRHSDNGARNWCSGLGNQPGHTFCATRCKEQLHYCTFPESGLRNSTLLSRTICEGDNYSTVVSKGWKEAFSSWFRVELLGPICKRPISAAAGHPVPNVLVCCIPRISMLCVSLSLPYKPFQHYMCEFTNKIVLAGLPFHVKGGACRAEWWVHNDAPFPILFAAIVSPIGCCFSTFCFISSCYASLSHE